MYNRNTIVIQSNHYTKEVKYFWKDDVKNTLSDLSENIGSPFSRAKPDHKKLSTGSLTEIARQVVSIIEETYNNSERGLNIEVNGTEEDYLAVKNVIDKFFHDQGMECMWSEHVQLPTVVMPEIKKIYRDLKTSLENDGRGIIELNDRNDEKEWLRSGFNWENIVSEEVLYSMCAESGVYLDKVMSEIKVEADRCDKEVSRIKKRLEHAITQKAGDGPKTKAEVDIDQLSKIMKKICEKHTKEIGKKFEKLLKDSEEKEYLDENRIIGLIRSAEDYADTHSIEWRKSSSADNLIGQRVDEQGRRDCVLKKVCAYFNEDVREYVDVINSEGIRFGYRSIEELKKKFMEEIIDSKKFTDEQKCTVRRRVFDGESVAVSFHILECENKIGEDLFKWKKETFDEKHLCKKYQKRLREELKNKRNDVLKENSKIFEEWRVAFFEMWKKQNSNIQSDSPQNEKQIRDKLKEYQANSRRRISLLNTFQEGRKKIDALISFRKG